MSGYGHTSSQNLEYTAAEYKTPTDPNLEQILENRNKGCKSSKPKEIAAQLVLSSYL
jgi:hypothetical protein